MFLPWVVELDWASWKPVPDTKKEAAGLFNMSGDELAASGSETGTDRLGRDDATTLVLVIEEGTEDTLSVENAASMLVLLVCH